MYWLVRRARWARIREQSWSPSPSSHRRASLPGEILIKPVPRNSLWSENREYVFRAHLRYPLRSPDSLVRYRKQMVSPSSFRGCVYPSVRLSSLMVWHFDTLMATNTIESPSTILRLFWRILSLSATLNKSIEDSAVAYVKITRTDITHESY